MLVDKRQVLSDATVALNRDDLPWQVTVEGDSIIGRWRWMDARFFSPNSVSDNHKEYSFTVTLKDNGKWEEFDKKEEKSSKIKFGGGNLAVGAGSYIKTSPKAISFGIGQTKKDDSFGAEQSTLYTVLIKAAIRGYLAQCGWKKYGLFG